MKLYNYLKKNLFEEYGPIIDNLEEIADYLETRVVGRLIDDEVTIQGNGPFTFGGEWEIEEDGYYIYIKCNIVYNKSYKLESIDILEFDSECSVLGTLTCLNEFKNSIPKAFNFKE